MDPKMEGPEAALRPDALPRRFRTDLEGAQSRNFGQFQSIGPIDR